MKLKNKIFHGLKSWNQTANKNAANEQTIGLKSRFFGYSIFKNPFLLFKTIKEYSIFNFYCGYTFLPIRLNHHLLYSWLGGSDVFWLKRKKKKVILHFQGCDIRHRFAEPQPVVCETCEIKNKFCTKQNNFRRQSRFRALIKVSDAVCVTTPDLLRYINHGNTHFLPKSIDTKALPKINSTYIKDKLRIVHAPSNRSKKGTDVIIKIVSKHPEKFELILVENKTREELFQIASNAHIAIDQIKIGWYGNFAVEMMAIGVPTIAFINNNLLPIYKEIGCAIINANELNLEKELLTFYQKKDFQDLSSSSINFVEKFHSVISNSQRLHKVYKSLNLEHK
jgi:hypothetical protein